jgi:mersacidin/lichenicidin family type 2 lantibiotic
MSEFDIVKVWKDASYRRSLTTKQLAQMPANPAGEIENLEFSRESFKMTISRQISPPCNNC